ncbi:hypothetical protein B5M43_009070 [Microbacterium sp. MEC084]|uniref:hypothetical protein n=1 Tax=Microbacterium sp. MEC084 TaxID=1963027 RepID=UPI00106FD5A8|nr:hypothetical protein [Microbacterium sp. MEC084]MCD1268988.1 hypothetical protein [Microbacterium sp. MEC084]
MSRLAPAAGLTAIATALLCLSAVPAHAAGGEVGGTGSTYYLNDEWSGQANHVIQYGRASDRAYVGDWNRDGKDTLAVRRGNRYYLTDAGGEPYDLQFAYGRDTDVTLTGDWNGDGVDTLAVRRGNVYYFTNQLTGGAAEAVIVYGRAGDQVLVGDWDGNGTDTLAVRRENRFYFANALQGGQASKVVAYGRASDQVYVGDWNGNRVDTPTVRRGATYYVTNRFAPGEAEQVLTFGRSTDKTLVGDWNGDFRDTLGVRRDGAPTQSATAAWAQAEFGTFTPVAISGTGNRDIPLPAGAVGGLLNATVYGDGPVTIETISGGTPVETLLQGDGPGFGLAIFGVGEAYHGDTIRITTAGAWHVKLQPLHTAPMLPTSGGGSGAFLWGGDYTDVTMRNYGGFFFAAQWNGEDSPSTGVIGEVEGEGATYDSWIDAGPGLIYIVADGTWEFEHH